MSVHNIRRTVLWTQMRDALVKDYPDADIPEKAGPAVTEFVEKVLRDSDYLAP